MSTVQKHLGKSILLTYVIITIIFDTIYDLRYKWIMEFWLRWANSEELGLSLVIRQKGESQNGCFKKTKQAKFSENRIFLTPWHAHIRMPITGKTCSFFGKFGVLFSWDIRFEIRPFALLLTNLEKLLRHNFCGCRGDN